MAAPIAAPIAAGAAGAGTAIPASQVPAVLQALRGLSPQALAVASSLVQGASPDPVSEPSRSAPPGTNRQLLASLLGGGSALGGQAVLDYLRGPTVGDRAPSNPYWIPFTDLREYQRFAGQEAFNRFLANLFTLGQYKPPYEIESPNDYQARIEAMRQREAYALNDRKIKEIQANRDYDVAIQNIISRADIARENIIKEREIAKQREVGLANVASQKTLSAYDTAKGLLDSTITNLLGSVPSSSAASSLALLPTVS